MTIVMLSIVGVSDGPWRAVSSRSAETALFHVKHFRRPSVSTGGYLGVGETEAGNHITQPHQVIDRAFKSALQYVVVLVSADPAAGQTAPPWGPPSRMEKQVGLQPELHP